MFLVSFRIITDTISCIVLQFDVGDELCGAVVSIRYQEDIISVWNKTAGSVETTGKIRFVR